jgi:hypothetical protein
MHTHLNTVKLVDFLMVMHQQDAPELKAAHIS